MTCWPFPRALVEDAASENKTTTVEREARQNYNDILMGTLTAHNALHQRCYYTRLSVHQLSMLRADEQELARLLKKKLSCATLMQTP